MATLQGAPTPKSDQFLRKASLVVSGSNQQGIDLSEMHFKFHVHQNDEQSPNNAEIRVYNLSDSSVRAITGQAGGVEYNRVTVQAGYKNSYGVIFTGTIKQFRTGRENSTDTYLDILAADGDLGYNFGFINMTIGGAGVGASASDVINAAVKAMAAADPNMSAGYMPALTGTENLRGKVLFGMARDFITEAAYTNKCRWSIQNGKVQIVPLSGYLPNSIVELNSRTGLIGTPEVTDEGLRARSLLNHKLIVAGLIRINNTDVNKLLQAKPDDPTKFDQYAGIQHIAGVSADGYYRAYVIEHTGDTRGNDWYSDLTCLSVDRSAGRTVANA